LPPGSSGGGELGEAKVLGSRNLEIQRGALDDLDGRSKLLDQIGIVGGDDSNANGACMRTYQCFAAKGLRRLRLPQ
jgi:6-phosphofructokinase